MKTIRHWDSHMHLHPFRPDWWAEQLVNNMERNGVCAGAISGLALMSPTSDDDVLRICRQYPNRLLPMLGRIDLNDERELERVEPLLRSGNWAGVGELFFHTSIPNISYPNGKESVTIPYPVPKRGAQNSVLGTLIRWCTELQIPLLIHAENAAAFEELLQRYPRSTLLWAHCDYVTPLADVRRVLERYPWLAVDFGPMIRCGYWDTETGCSHWLETDRGFWRELCSDFSDRLLLGADAFSEKYAEAARYDHIYRSYADFLSTLPAAKAENIVANNFQRIFRTYLKHHPAVGKNQQ